MPRASPLPSSAHVLPVQTLDAYLRRLGWRWLALPSVVMVLLSAFALKDVHEHQTAELDAVVHDMAKAVEVELQRRVQGLQAVTSAVTQANAAPSLADWYGYSRGYDLTFDSPVVLAHPDRRMKFNTRMPLGTVLPDVPKPARRSAFDEALASGQPGIGDVVWGPVVKMHVVTAIAPVISGGQRLALLALIPAARFQDLLSQRSIPEGWHAALRDTAGQLVASIDGEAPWADAWPLLSQRRVITTEVASWTVAVQADAWGFYEPHLKLAALLALGLALAFAGSAMAARRAQRGLVKAARQLVPGGSGAALPDGPPDGQQVPRIAEIEQARAELAQASLARLEAEDVERERIARDLHDGLQQRAASIKLRLDMALQHMPPPSVGSGLVRDAADQIEDFIGEIDHTVRRLRPSSLEQLGLSAAMKGLMAQSAEASSVHGELEFVGEEAAVDALPAALAECLYRVLQESLNNVRKHARAGFVHAVLDVSAPDRVLLSVSDDGLGIDEHSAQTRPGFGLRGMWQRVHVLGGSLQVRRGHHKDLTHGTTVEVHLPVHPPGHASVYPSVHSPRHPPDSAVTIPPP